MLRVPPKYIPNLQPFFLAVVFVASRAWATDPARKQISSAAIETGAAPQKWLAVSLACKVRNLIIKSVASHFGGADGN